MDGKKYIFSHKHMQAMQQYIRTVSDNGNGGDDRARKKSVPHAQAHIRARKKNRLHQLKKITDGEKLLECFVLFGGLKANRHNDIVAQ